MADSSPNRLTKNVGKGELLVTSNLSFSHCLFKRLVLQTRKNQELFGKGLKTALYSGEKCYFSVKTYKISPPIALNREYTMPHSQINSLTRYQTTTFWTGPN